jgi:serine/threonine-protein kinase
MNGIGTQTAQQFLGAVDAACSDLAPTDRARLLGGLEEHLAELSAEGVDLVAELGDPIAYAAELRSAAGMPPAATQRTQSVPAAGIVPGPPMPAVTQPGPSAGKVLLIVGAVLAAIAVLVTAAVLFGGLLLFSTSSSGGSSSEPVASAQPVEIAVPDVTGMNQEQARSMLEQAGLVLASTTAQPSSDVPADLVLSQDPAAGSSVPPGSTVSLVVSSGP